MNNKICIIEETSWINFTMNFYNVRAFFFTAMSRTLFCHCLNETFWTRTTLTSSLSSLNFDEKTWSLNDRQFKLRKGKCGEKSIATGNWQKIDYVVELWPPLEKFDKIFWWNYWPRFFMLRLLGHEIVITKRLNEISSTNSNLTNIHRENDFVQVS